MMASPALTILCAASFAACALLSGCQGDVPDETRVAVIGEEAASDLVATASEQGLVRYDATGAIQPALAESWHVSDDGKSYIFRIAPPPGAEEVDAKAVAAALRTRLADAPLYDSTEGIDDVVAMTDRVLEIRLAAPRPNLLYLLADPALAIDIGDGGTGPFRIADRREREIFLTRDLTDRFGDVHGRERVRVSIEPARAAIAEFVSGDVEIVLGGTFDALPLVRDAAISRGSLRYDPVAGLFGLVPLSKDGIAGDPEARRLLSQAIDRQALVDALGVPALTPRATILQGGTDLRAPPAQPAWLSQPELRGAVALRFAALYPDREDLVIRVSLPDGPGGVLLLRRLREDWGALDIDVQRTDRAAADFALVDEVAPSPGAGWFVRRFTCKAAAVCDKDIDDLIDAARLAPLVDQRRAILSDAGARMDEAALFISLAAPVRWSLVAPTITGFAENRFAVHVLTDLKKPLQEEGR